MVATPGRVTESVISYPTLGEIQNPMLCSVVSKVILTLRIGGFFPFPHQRFLSACEKADFRVLNRLSRFDTATSAKNLFADGRKPHRVARWRRQRRLRMDGLDGKPLVSWCASGIDSRLQFLHKRTSFASTPPVNTKGPLSLHVACRRSSFIQLFVTRQMQMQMV